MSFDAQTSPPAPDNGIGEEEPFSPPPSKKNDFFANRSKFAYAEVLDTLVSPSAPIKVNWHNDLDQIFKDIASK